MNILKGAQSKSASTDKRGDLVKARGTTSWVHHHFSVYSNLKSTANCNLCNKDLAWNSSTSTLTDHIRLKHNDTFLAAMTKKAADAEAKAEEEGKRKVNTQPLSVMNRHARELSILKFIVHQGLPKGMLLVPAIVTF